jgi:hypothetical protein
VDHGLEPQVNLSSSDNLSHVTWIIRLKESNLNALILEEILGLGQVQRSMIRRGVPFPPNRQPMISNAHTEKMGSPTSSSRK